MRYYCKVRKKQGEVVVAVCDEDIRGMVFNDGKFVLEVKDDFYGDELFEKDEILTFLEEATIANLTGNSVVSEAISRGLVDADRIIEVEGVPHAQIVMI